MASLQDNLVDLVDYVGHMIKLGEKPVLALADYRQLLFHEADLKDRIGIEHDKSDDNGVLWLKMHRLKRIDPPEVPEEILDWITVGRDPFTQPTVQAVRTETIHQEQANEYVKLGILDESDIQPALKSSGAIAQCDVIFRIEKQPNIKRAVEDYISGPWSQWAEEERPRWETIRMYEAFFSLQQSIQSQGSENPLELVWGIGVARWRASGQVIDHPLVEQLVEIEIDSGDGSIVIRPRGTQPQLALKPFFALDNPGAETVLNFARDFFANFTEDEELSPFLPDTFTPVLRRAASHLDQSGQYYPDEMVDITYRGIPPVSDTLTVTDTWAIYARQRSDNFFLNDLDRLKDAIKSTQDLPSPSKRLVTEPSSVRYTGGPLDIGKATLTGFGGDGGSTPVPGPTIDATQTHEFFFPKPFNEEQISIIRNLEKTDGVVVQGPPGTGKTHTIANIICHYLAIGKKVLVTSKAEAALTVLRTHIPEGIRELTISLLTNEREGLKQLERAVNLLASTATQRKPEELKRDIITGQERIIELNRKIDEIDTELREWAKKHLKRIGAKRDKQGILPMDLAKRVMDNRERHSWLPDRPGANKKFNPKITDKDIALARGARKALGSDLLYLDKKLPSMGDLPDAASLAAVHRDLVNAERLEHQTTAQKIPVLSVSVPDALERAKEVLKAVNEIIKFLKIMEDSPWFHEIFKTWQRQGVDAKQVALFNDIIPAMKNIAALRTSMLGYVVKLPAGAHQHQDLCMAIERATNAQRPFGFISFGKSEAKTLLQQIQIQGRAPQSTEDWEKIAAYVGWRKDITAFVSRWNVISSEFNLPELADEGETTGRWVSGTLDKIDKARAILNSHFPLIKAELPELFPYGMEASMIIKSRETAEAAADTIKINLAKNRLLSSRNRISDLLDRLAQCSGPIVEEIHEFLSGSVGNPNLKEVEITDRWQAICLELTRLHNLRPQIQTVERVAGLLRESGGTHWANALMTQPVTGIDDLWTPGNWFESWTWARQENYLKQIDGRGRISELSAHRMRCDDELKKIFEEVVKLRTFLGLKKNLTELVESALVMFTNAIRRIGKGTGIRAQRFRRDARRAMERSYSAVPCWIMPTWRVSESLPAELGSFDLVVVDEASQSDISALPALVRGKKLLIVGDDKQVSPTAAFIEEKKLLQLRHNYLRNQPFSQEMLQGASLYDLARAVFPGQRIMLREHFRCVEPIIRFSFQFYDDELFPLRVPKASERLDPPLIDVYIPHGRKDKRQINIAEAEAIVDEVERIISDPSFTGRRIGVVSLIGAKQAQYIQSLLLARIGEDAFLRHEITCGDSATFQGKERDIMFVSMVECPETKSAKTALLFQQRFNVALSRARDRMYLFRSVNEEMLNPEDLKAKVIRHFKSPMASAVHEAGDMIELCESDFERDVVKRLVKLGYRVTPQVKVGSYSIDMVVEGDEDRRLAIELDGDQYHTPDRWADDFARQRVLERVGWRFWRCWGSSFILDPEGCMEELHNMLDSMGIVPLEGEIGSTVYTEHRVIESETREADEGAKEFGREAIVPVSEQMPLSFGRQEARETDRQTEIVARSADTDRTMDSDEVSLAEAELPVAVPSGFEEDSFVEIGDRVLISYNDDPTLQHTIKISATEHDPDMKIIRANMPLAQALIDAEINEEVGIPAGGKTRMVTIIKIEKPL